MAKGRSWTPEEDKQLGTASDGEIAERLGRTRGAIALRRLRLNIPAFGWFSHSRHSKWGPTEIVMFLRCSDAEVARITGRRLKEVQAKRNELHGSK